MLSFITQAIKNTYHTGAFCPSSQALARVMTRSFRDSSPPRRILEVGPGTGPFTKAILGSLDERDEFHIVEINEQFADALEEKLLAPYRKQNPGARIFLHRSPIEEVDLENRFDFIVCGLPFNNFPPAITRSIFKQLLQLLEPDGELAYFEYAAVRAFRSVIVGPDGRAKIKRIDAHGRSMRRRFNGTREFVLANFPPAYAVRLKGA